MASNVDVKVVVKHIVEGDLAQNLCRICLLPLSEEFESVFTTICKEDRAYSVADVLENVCRLDLSESEHFHVCKDCFYSAASAYKFYLTVTRSTEILQAYTDELHQQILSVPLENVAENSLCFTLPDIEIKTRLFDFDLDGCLKRGQKLSVFYEESENDDENTRTFDYNIKSEPTQNDDAHDETYIFTEGKSDEDTNTFCVYVTERDGYQNSTANNPETILPDTKTTANHRRKKDRVKVTEGVVEEPVRKVRKKRSPLAFIQCSKCPIKYRFLSRLKVHMKTEHGLNVYICKLCKTTCETEQEFTQHLRSHRGVQPCYICEAVFRKPEALTAHIDEHLSTASMKNSEKAHICEQCGTVLPDESKLQEHYDEKHLKKFTCHYCGRLYKGKMSLDKHIEKHEMIESNGQLTPNKSEVKSKSSTLTCDTCGKRFVDARALQWHSMLHTNERPFKCDVCGRGFISVNRRNQHALCAHTAPTRRCPLCPALFHLRSMVNTHIKKVHLTAHKRRMRTSKHQNASWRTVAVPIPDLSVELQSHIMELKSKLNEFESDEM